MAEEPSMEISRPRKMKSKVVVDGNSDLLPAPGKAKPITINAPVQETEESRRIKEELRQQNQAAKAKLARKKAEPAEPSEKERKRVLSMTPIEEARKRRALQEESNIPTPTGLSFDLGYHKDFVAGVVCGASAVILAQRLFGSAAIVKAIASQAEEVVAE